MSFINNPFKYLFRNANSSYKEFDETTERGERDLGESIENGSERKDGNSQDFIHDYQTVFYNENWTQTEPCDYGMKEPTEKMVYIVVNNNECICAYTTEVEAKNHINSLVPFLMCTGTYKIINGNAIFIYQGQKLQYKITYYKIPLKFSYHMSN